MTDKLLRWKLRVAVSTATYETMTPPDWRHPFGQRVFRTAHPFVVTEPMTVYAGTAKHPVLPYVRELPIEPYAVPWGHEAGR